MGTELNETIKGLQPKAFTSSSTIASMVAPAAMAFGAYQLELIDLPTLLSTVGMALIGIIQRIRTKGPVRLPWEKS